MRRRKWKWIGDTLRKGRGDIGSSNSKLVDGDSGRRVKERSDHERGR